jgi:uncharacterized protein
MAVATLYLDWLVIGCTSVREKRRRMRTIMDKRHQHFNVSVAEVDRDDDPRQARLDVAAISRTRRETRQTLERAADAISVHPRAALLSQAITEV